MLHAQDDPPDAGMIVRIQTIQTVWLIELTGRLRELKGAHMPIAGESPQLAVDAAVDAAVEAAADYGTAHIREQSVEAFLAASVPANVLRAALELTHTRRIEAQVGAAVRISAEAFKQLAAMENRNLLAHDANVSEDDIAAILIAAVPRKNAWSAVIGPVYTAKTIATYLKKTEASVSKKATEGKLLRLHTSDNRAVYPAFQFRARFQPVDGLDDVLRELHRGTEDEWTWAQWLRAENPELGGSRAIDLLRDGLIRPVVENARVTADSWAA